MRSYLTLLMAMVVFSLCDTSDSGCASAKRVSVNLDPVVAEKNWGNRRFWKGGKSLRDFMKKGRVNSKQLELVKTNPSAVKQFEGIKKNPSFSSIKSSVEISRPKPVIRQEIYHGKIEDHREREP
ncbi:hypothetical protein PHYSODRAFT_329170 [Phytophthora sojae]|uniref:RxLR effector protein n=1 Tax=Phytophthora sojae (strain P6497) TaxID=1094619 RepID=G4Z990_PHYSP|nr:hypothetical protein PHYSODRAFT_329170 [Phytophthora sojae]EGZ21144.1 hypothetical protein PHYSODRAFT_329170 [Phytophthora sojae]|eukprot:XP_009523861.1 hypothetical protein PHYSODRAFT_329170 [Phytophthora sojae]